MRCKTLKDIEYQGETIPAGSTVDVQLNHVAILVDRGSIVKPKEAYPSMRPNGVMSKGERDALAKDAKEKKKIDAAVAADRAGKK